jgi:hypothetical protein
MVIGREGTEGSYHYFLYRTSRASQAVSAVDGRERRRGARIGWYLSRRAARVQKAKATRDSRFNPNRHGGAVPCA